MMIIVGGDAVDDAIMIVTTSDAMTDKKKATGCTTYTKCMMAHYYHYDHRLRRQAAHGKCMALLLPYLLTAYEGRLIAHL